MILNNLSDVLNSEKCIIKCGADWCSPCHQQDDIIKNNHLDDYMKNNKIDYYYMNVDNGDDNFMELYEIKCIPVLLFFKKGKLTKKLISLQSYDVLKKEIDEFLK